MVKERDYLDEDPKIAGQNFACVTFVSPDSNQKADAHGLKLRGVFESKEEAYKRAKYLQEYDPDFDIYVVDMFRWLEWFPDPSKVPEEYHANEQLNQIDMIGKNA